MSELPNGWCITKLGQLIEFKYGKALPDRMRSGSGFPVYGSNGIVGYHNEALTNAITIIIGRKGSVGEIHLSELPCFPIDTTYYIDKFPDNFPRYWFYQLKILNLGELNKATAIPGLNRMDAYNQDIVLAPLNEQKRIADKLDSILARIDACRERLDHIPVILKRFRQSVLAAATSGKLTEEWRNETGNDKPWKTVRLAEIAHIQGGVTKDSKKQSLNDEEVPYLRVANVQRGYLDLGDIKIIRIPVSKLNALLLEPGDILFNEGGDIDKLGRGWIWEGQIEQCSFQNHVFRARLYDKKNQPKYISWWGNYRGLNYFLRSGKQTTNLASINKSMLSELPINLPSFEEQTEIVRRVEEMFAYADRIEARYHAARARIDKLTPAILAKAFRGELVPQNPDDEPASVLLDRIRASRAANAATSKPERRRNRGAK
ncbi:MAG: restriction endonuclease subunit S [Burkholderiales bacterium]|nr:restriction endonuclease subunit S [Burkholderiales bacterium]